MIHLAFVLNLHQPPDQHDSVMEKVVQECYLPLLDFLEHCPGFCLNLTWSLTEKWLDLGYHECLGRIRSLLEAGHIEITGTAAYHPILPLLGPDEIRRQIVTNLDRQRQILGPSFNPRGLFPPELGFGHELPPVLLDLGYQWCLAEDIPYLCLHQSAPYQSIPSCASLPVLLRSSLWSNLISLSKSPSGRPYSGQAVAEGLIYGCGNWFGDEDGYLVIALDGETFGHHLPGHIESFLWPFARTLWANQDRIRLRFPSQLLERFPVVPSEVPPGSWSTTAEDFWKGDFFPHWKSKHNEAHHILWELTDMAVHAVDQLQDRLARTLNSWTFWWADPESSEMPASASRGLSSLLDIISGAAPEQLPRARALADQMQRLFDSGRSPAHG